MPKIFNFNPERGFGFVQTEKGRAFVHVSSIEGQIPRGIDLNGRALVEVETETGQKGLHVTSAKITPLKSEWSFGVSSIRLQDVFFPGRSELCKKYDVLSEEHKAGENFAKPVLDVSALRQARDNGCPAEVLSSAVASFRRKNAEWWQKVHAQSAKESAVDAAGKIVKAGLPKSKKVLIFASQKPEATQWLSEGCISLFDEKWLELIASVQIAGSNDLYQWAIVPSDESFDVQSVVGNSSMTYQFITMTPYSGAENWKFQIAFGQLRCGERSPHKKYKE